MKLDGFIGKYKNKILNINIALIIVALIIANNIYKRQTVTMALLKRNNDAEIKKNEVLENISQLEKKINSYKNALNKKDMTLVMNAVNNIAKELGIKIISFKPQNEKDYSVYVKYPFNLAIGIKDYHQLGRFVAKIENSADIYMVDSMNIRTLAEEQKGAGETEKFTVELILSRILFKG